VFCSFLIAFIYTLLQPYLFLYKISMYSLETCLTDLFERFAMWRSNLMVLICCTSVYVLLCFYSIVKSLMFRGKWNTFDEFQLLLQDSGNIAASKHCRLSWFVFWWATRTTVYSSGMFVQLSSCMPCGIVIHQRKIPAHDWFRSRHMTLTNMHC